MSMASAPTRGDKLTIQFGLVNVPVTVYNGVDENAAKIKRSRYSPQGNKVEQHNIDPVTGEEIAFSDFVLKYETSEGTLVDLDDDEVALAMGVANGDSKLVGVYPLSETKVFRYDGPLQIMPQTTKVGTKTTHPYDKAFALFIGALSDSATFAVVWYVTRGKPKLVAIFPDGSARSVFWDNEVRADVQHPIVEVTLAERELANKLVASLMTKTAEPIENEAVEKVRLYAEAKAAGGAPTMPAPVEVKSTDDIMALLAASVPA